MILSDKPTWDELRAWQQEGAEKQAKVLDAMISKYYTRLRLQQTLNLIERILNDKCN